ncbi:MULTISPECIES: alpha/beta hydrolase [unclassified Streptomyces]|uniref:alpha/beta hydrolase n=1 Tax=unclassified Streptomyces TaxID=2593676 RepID=UPI00225AFD23|nr:MULTISPECIES: alpha/beta fold hydrolase [unclassified Streptomyces]MCX5336344.1 lysophospholipase [Streptomyces sp. NBC_00140]MCX5367065.1 lysophospholipase [Streptomyces sp. NBC_00124]
MHHSLDIPVGDITLRGRLYLPENATGPVPVVIAHEGIGSVAEVGFPYAHLFTDVGLGVAFYDHRGLGYSDGEPRQQIDPWQFARDMRHVITHLSLREDVDPAKIAVWGFSLGGAIGMFAAATDNRPAAVVSVIPPVSGISARKLFPPAELAGLDAAIVADRVAQGRGGPPLLLQTSGERTADGPPVMFTDPEGLEFIKRFDDIPSFRNQLTLSSLDYVFEMEITAYAERITAPVLMVLADSDTVAPVEDAREMFKRITAPKELVEYPGQHYGILLNHFEEIISRTTSWLAQTLL